jgi:four helix bundle protein
MNQMELKQRTKAFALRAIKMTQTLPKSMAADVVGRQLLRSSTSVAANYRAACRSRSRAEFVAKMGVVEEEADESAFWLEMLADSALMKPVRLSELAKKADELVAIAVASIRTARNRRGPSPNPQSAIRNPQ